MNSKEIIKASNINFVSKTSDLPLSYVKLVKATSKQVDISHPLVKKFSISRKEKPRGNIEGVYKNKLLTLRRHISSEGYSRAYNCVYACDRHAGRNTLMNSYNLREAPVVLYFKEKYKPVVTNLLLRTFST